MNLDTDFEFQTVQLAPDYEGPVTSTLISSKFNCGNRPAVLYLHGYIDYFFHPHVCVEFINRGIDFYALDLRKYGRSLMQHQHPNYCRDMQEYFEEVTIAIQQIRATGEAPIYLLGHSTGGLLASYYMNDGQEKSSIDRLILNSPFLKFNKPALEIAAMLVAARVVSAFMPFAKVEGALSPAYAQSVHKNYFGEWDFNLAWKPIEGFPTYFKWILAIANAQKRLLSPNIQVPILTMHSSRSLKLTEFSEDAMSADIVLNVEDIKRIGAQLGRQVTLLEIENAQHDIFLSPRQVRGAAFKQMFAWLGVAEP